MADIFQFFYALQSYAFMQRAMLAAIIIGVVCSLVGVFILLRGMIFLGEAIAHSAFAGAALALLIKINPLLSILGFSVGSAVGIGYVNEKQVMRNEIIIGIVFSFFMALAILFIGLMEQYSTEVQSILFGNILLVTQENFVLLLAFGAIVLALLIFTKKELFLMTFDTDYAEITGIPVRLLNYLFLILISITISVSLKAIGAVLVFALIVTPAAAAYQWTFQLNRLLVLAAAFGVFGSVFGLVFSYLLDVPSGSTIVTVVTAVFILSFIFSPKRRQAKLTPVDCVYCKEYILEERRCEDPDDCPAAKIPHQHTETGYVIKKNDLPKKEPTKHDHS
ncbi:MAG: metal ABC transporter permease [Candidatus Hermodarchaeota archaeon]